MASPLPYNRQNALASAIAVDNAANIAGKVILTTGVTQGGLGATFVEAIAIHQPKLLILAGRSPSKVQATVDKIKSNPASANVEVRTLVLDLSLQKQIREAAKEVLAYPELHIDVVVNSAGTMGGPFRTTVDGIEYNFATNHIGHFLFTNLIMPKVLVSKAPRIVNVSSDGHRFGGIRFDDWNFQGGKVYDQWEAYGQSKTANILFSYALAQMLGPKGLKAYSLHPGQTMGTSLVENFGEEDLASLMAKDQVIGWTRGFDFKSLDECAATHVVAAFDTRLDDYNGAYLDHGNLAPHEVQPTARKPEDVEKLWKLSEKLVGEEFAY
ncbi:WW domain-containing oxidoreductase [Pyrenophora seminiperda CCB06]|uniref:WW domain-containing oxidoreductase n=1 Tax=Pyrenophora seminiperda CCB06 TaxID=1302712 RepID=A0A3M7M7U1_9PLEO|nr:WW domain-containing oxidoreductase [Pyrenophora seminiperda CCB06]